MQAKLHICDNSGSLSVMSTCTTHCAMSPIYHRFCGVLSYFQKAHTQMSILTKVSCSFKLKEDMWDPSISKKMLHGNRNCHNIDLYKGLHITLSNRIVSLHSFTVILYIYIFQYFAIHFWCIIFYTYSQCSVTSSQWFYIFLTLTTNSHKASEIRCLLTLKQ